MGDFVGYRLQVGFLRRKRAAVEALGPAATSTEVAEKIRGAKRIPLSGIDTAELKVFDGGSQSAKELGVEGSGLLTIRTSAGEELLWFVRGDAAELGSILSNLLGTRLTRN